MVDSDWDYGQSDGFSGSENLYAICLIPLWENIHIILMFILNMLNLEGMSIGSMMIWWRMHLSTNYV